MSVPVKVSKVRNRTEATGPQSALEVRALRRCVLDWYDRSKRALPWRAAANDPYAVLVSEIMLQQTQVATVVPYYDAFLERFPTVQALAGADIDDVLPYWAGLGYYRRCHHLHEAARRIAIEHAGQWPRNSEGFRALPGIGEYTAAAVASIVHHESVPALDGNAKRVWGRFWGFSNGRKPNPRSLNEIHPQIRSIMPHRRPGDFNQAIMEIGARVCRPRNPECGRCPLEAWCRFESSDVENVTRVRDCKSVDVRDWVCVALVRKGRAFYRRRPVGGLWSGLWEWPSMEFNGIRSRRRVMLRLLGSLGCQAPDRVTFQRLEHQLTHRLIRFHACHIDLPAEPRIMKRGRWRSAYRPLDLAVSTAQARLIDMVFHQP